MAIFNLLTKNKIENLPKTSGVYAFKDKNGVFYIGKAVNIKERVKNHFQQPSCRDNLFVDKITKVGFIKTNSEIEALILEAELIKKYQPKFNIMWRDDKNYFYIVITKEKCPVISIAHQLQLKTNYIGPFIDGTSLKKTLKLLRKIFPFYSQKNHPKKPCLWCHLKLCPGPNPDLRKYKKNIKNLIAVLKEGKQSVLKNLKKEMKKMAKKEEFETAAKIRNQIFSLEKIFSHAKVLENITVPRTGLWNWQGVEQKLRNSLKMEKKVSRIEGYDISNIQGKEATGSMVTFIEGKPDKNLYRKFKIRAEEKPNDTAMIKEVLSRRLGHQEWPIPELMLIDGGIAQLNAALKVKNQNANFRKKIKILSLAKKNNDLFVEGRRKPIPLKTLSREIFNIILQIRDESHRFAIVYHHQLRKNSLN